MEDDCDELPPISVNTRSNSKNTFTMPPADVLASQRAREVECERELQLLRKLHTSEEVTSDVQMMRSDSSGSDGENSLVAAVDILRVQPDVNTAQKCPTPADKLFELMSRLLLHLPEKDSQFIRDHLNMLEIGCPTSTKYFTCEILEELEPAVYQESAWDAPSILCCSAWLCAVSASGIGMDLQVIRTLQTLLKMATDKQVEMLARIMSETLQTPKLMLELSDAVRGGLGASRKFGILLIQLALDMEQCPSVSGCSTSVQLIGRATAAGLQTHLPPSLVKLPKDASKTDRLKVAVEASKLQLLFHNKN